VTGIGWKELAVIILVAIVIIGAVRFRSRGDRG
jgi:Sec-independent protein translocase protein TatA